MYFSFLFVLRAVVRGCPALVGHQYITGDPADDEMVRLLMADLCADPGTLELTRNGKSSSNNNNNNSNSSSSNSTNAAQCRIGFDESTLFSEDTSFYHPTTGSRWDETSEAESGDKSQLREEFRGRFRNISRIMNCVTCERCRVWGKLQILGIGTAIKLLLTPEESLQPGFLRRQEVIALINTLHQFSRSIEFAAKAGRLELEHKMNLGLGLGIRVDVLAWIPHTAAGLAFMLILLILSRRQRSQQSSPQPKKDGID
jgi:ERO1-like protein alpha